MEKQGKNKISLKKILNIIVIIGAFLGFSGILIAVLSVVAHFVIKNDDLMNLEFNTLLNSVISAHLFLIRLLAKREMMFSFFISNRC